ncbi:MULTISPECIES: putative 2-aminoethylphosphonate ABC transporter permease subunit [unclassified Clostridioides]|uniref:putative 2-aminoethylphosphonate ABC transporter permease subunit n=1 Tax=unclassified Clostridioides TaxID=2635829 RepID=UPI001D10BA05|nr:putative 2-aminoethylphosphonate ABC transporter permease subunit [Clostridioides sp. ZZV14-6150]MCC0668096.1 putative 2-aminoethylphosphonate ABC transporter permease subunit [Clostridioides sp. ZZV14-6153]MCC0717377.1 putative 2-aminoethylphosphonate ABC transporter permease subunit [Clostridioides sp. ZZV14-6105]MCC0721496.1 putative 2-aminoethylphosphonate ABC transporter permease subunit [Clostridioides sp. ZZV14-6104]MCC0727873.1 putative 2-aminoethylphosphonate ABC transporter permeas
MNNNAISSKSINIKSKMNLDIKKCILTVLVMSLVIFLLAPIIYLFVQAFLDKDGVFVGLQNFREYLASEALLNSLKNTIFVSVISTIISLTLALVYAYALTRTKIKFKGLLKSIAMFPMFAPTMMHAIGLVYLFGNQGVVTNLLGINIPIYGSIGIVLAQIIYVFPQSFQILYISLNSTDYRLYEASNAMGISKIREFLSITIPSIKYSLISSTFVSFTLCFTDFGAPKVIGGDFNVLSIDVYKQIIGQQNMPMGATVSILLLIPAIISFIVTKKIEKNQNSYINSKSIPYKVKSNKLRDSMFGVIVGIIAFGIIAVMLTVILSSLISVWPYDLRLTLEHFSMKSSIDGIKPFINSIEMSLLTAILGTSFVFLFAYLNEKTEKAPYLKSFGYFLSTLPMALPGLVLGIAYVLFFNKLEFNLMDTIYIKNLFNGLYGTLFIMVICNVVHFFSVAFITATTAIKKVDKELDMVAKSMGINSASILKNVTIPLCLPAVLENFMYFFLNSMVTISALVFIYTASSKVAAISIVQLDDKGSTAQAAALAVLILITNVLVKVIHEFIKNRLEKRANFN